MAQSLADVISADRTRLQTALNDLGTRRKALDEEEHTIRQELRAIDAYENARRGKVPATTVRAQRGARSETLHAMIAGSKGMTRAQILDEVGAKGNKSQEGSISNALATMKKKGTLALKDGVYTAL